MDKKETTNWWFAHLATDPHSNGRLVLHSALRISPNRSISERTSAMSIHFIHIKPVIILGSENCQSISFQNLLSASHLFRLCDLPLSTEAVRQLQSFCQTTAPHITCNSCHYGQTKQRVTKLRSSQRTFQPVVYHHSLSWWLQTGLWNSLWIKRLGTTARIIVIDPAPRTPHQLHSVWNISFCIPQFDFRYTR